MKRPLHRQSVDYLDTLAEDFNGRVGEIFTPDNNLAVQAMIERLRLLNHAMADCSPAALNSLTKKYNKALKAQGGFQYKRDKVGLQ
jgi:hypothetical protein